MKESDVRNEAGIEESRQLPDVAPGAEQGEVKDAPKPAKRKADDEWLAFAAEDPAFFIKTSDTV